MAVEEAGETTVNASGGVTIPAAIRDALDVEEGDKIRWTADEDGELSVEVIHQRERVFEDFEPMTRGDDRSAEEVAESAWER